APVAAAHAGRDAGGVLAVRRRGGLAAPPAPGPGRSARAGDRAAPRELIAHDGRPGHLFRVRATWMLRVRERADLVAAERAVVEAEVVDGAQERLAGIAHVAPTGRDHAPADGERIVVAVAR